MLRRNSFSRHIASHHIGEARMLRKAEAPPENAPPEAAPVSAEDPNTNNRMKIPFRVGGITDSVRTAAKNLFNTGRLLSLALPPVGLALNVGIGALNTARSALGGEPVTPVTFVKETLPLPTMLKAPFKLLSSLLYEAPRFALQNTLALGERVARLGMKPIQFAWNKGDAILRYPLEHPVKSLAFLGLASSVYTIGLVPTINAILQFGLSVGSSVGGVVAPTVTTGGAVGSSILSQFQVFAATHPNTVTAVAAAALGAWGIKRLFFGRSATPAASPPTPPPTPATTTTSTPAPAPAAAHTP